MAKRTHGRLSDAQYQERMRQAQRRRDSQRHSDLLWLLENEPGRRLAYWLVFGDPSDERPHELIGRLTSAVFDINLKYNCELQAARIDGARQMAMEIGDALQGTSPELYALMVQEQLESRIRELALTRKAEQESTDDDS